MLLDDWIHQKIICKSSFPWDALLRIYKQFIRPHLDYGDIMTNHLMSLLKAKLKIFNIKFALY